MHARHVLTCDLACRPPFALLGQVVEALAVQVQLAAQYPSLHLAPSAAPRTSDTCTLSEGLLSLLAELGSAPVRSTFEQHEILDVTTFLLLEERDLRELFPATVMMGTRLRLRRLIRVNSEESR